ncbi:MAG: hypothetical protein A3J83_08860 [Elusimicrobia bacterium RIFOXYA2_FULL_40_6]|nr:MAG: hypothetical protein A3J83_08860 [Elusimicrobia bacterium RIFOXYA2_FULL_40_6]
MRTIIVKTILILCALIALSELAYNIGSFRTGMIGKDEISLFESRLQPLKSETRNNIVVSYVSDTTGDDFLKEYYLTQYALAPLVVTKKQNCRFAIYSFHKPVNSIKLIERK